MTAEHFKAILIIGKALATVPALEVEQDILQALAERDHEALGHWAGMARMLVDHDKGDHAPTKPIVLLAGALEFLAKEIKSGVI